MEEARSSIWPSDERIRVLLCHDGARPRAVVRELLDHEASVLLVGEARGARACLQLVRDCRPDVVLLDLAMPVLDGLKTFKSLRAGCPELPCVVMLSSFDARRFCNRLLELGARGCVDKSAPLDDLLSMLRFAAADDHAISHTGPAAIAT